MSDSEPARKKARKQVSFREANEISPSGSHNGPRSEAASEDGGNSLLPRKIMDSLEEVRMVPSSLTTEDLADEDNEVWVLHCPANVDPTKFLAGNKIRLEGQTEYEIGETSEKYEVVALPKHDSNSSLAVLLPGEDGKNKLVGAPISGHFMIKEKIEEIAIPALKPEPKPHHKIPDGIRQRHPIYGTDYEEIFKSMDRSSPKPKKKRKSKKHESRDDEEVSVPPVDDRRKSKKASQPELVVNVEETDYQSKKKSKHVNGWANGSIKEEPETPSESKKKKKKRHREESENFNGSYINGYTNGYHHDTEDSIHRNGKIKKEKVQSEDEYSAVQHKKSKKKSKHCAS